MQLLHTIAQVGRVVKVELLSRLLGFGLLLIDQLRQRLKLQTGMVIGLLVLYLLKFYVLGLFPLSLAIESVRLLAYSGDTLYMTCITTDGLDKEAFTTQETFSISIENRHKAHLRQIIPLKQIQAINTSY